MLFGEKLRGIVLIIMIFILLFLVFKYFCLIKKWKYIFEVNFMILEKVYVRGEKLLFNCNKICCVLLWYNFCFWEVYFC